MRKLNRSKLLGLVTAGAIVVTTAFSFAAWDILSDTATGTVNIGSPVTVEATDFSFTGSGTETGQDGARKLTYTTDVTFTLSESDVSPSDFSAVGSVTPATTGITATAGAAQITGTTAVVPVTVVATEGTFTSFEQDLAVQVVGTLTKQP